MRPFLNSRRAAGDVDRNAIVTVALFAPFVLVLALIAYTVQGERARRGIEARVLRDYSVMLGSEVARRTTDGLHNQITMVLSPPMHGARTPSLMLEPAELLTPPRTTPTMRDTCIVLPYVRGTIRLELPSRRVSLAGNLSRVMSERIVAFATAAARSAPSTEPHVFALDTIAGAPRVLGIYAQRDSTRPDTVVYGLVADIGALDTIVNRFLQRESLFPSAVVRPPYTSSHVLIAIRSRAGAAVWSNGEISPASAGTDTLPAMAGRSIVQTQAGPAVARELLIGRPSPLYLPALAALLLLSAALAVVALVQLRRSRDVARLRNRFVANVSHELRTPLTQISMFAEMLALERDRDPGERRHYAEVIRREVVRLTTLVEGVLRFSRSQDGSSTLKRERRNLAMEVRDAAEFFGIVAAGADVRINLEDVSDVSADIDPAAFRQVLLNLLDNAVKYGPRGQTIYVSVAQRDNRAVISVTDEGPGIPREDRERVFEPYARLDRPDQPRVAGAGIGLAVVRELIHAHDGSVFVDDTTRGTRITIHIPSASLAPAS
jgi:signal transduction histidine kinase